MRATRVANAPRRPRTGRPRGTLGVKASAILNLVQRQPLSIRALAHKLQLSYTDACKTVPRLVDMGYLRYGDEQRQTGGRPARVIELVADRAQHAAPCELADSDWQLAR